MMEEFSQTGGALIGLAHATWPLATLTVNRNQLALKAGIIGNLYFRPCDVVSIEPFSLGLSTGIKIIHLVEKYKSKVVFTASFGAKDLLSQIAQTGFLANKNALPADVEQQILAMQAQGGFPIKTSAKIAILIIWNVLFLFDIGRFLMAGAKGFPLGIGAKLALGFALMGSLSMLLSEPVRRMVLKDGFDLEHIRRFLYLLVLVSGLMLAVLSSINFPVF